MLLDDKSPIKKIAMQSTKTVAEKLGDWVGKTVTPEFVQVQVIPSDRLNEIKDEFKGDIVFAIGLTGKNSSGRCYMEMNMKDAEALSSLLNNKWVPGQDSEARLSALKETTNLVIGIYLNEFVRLAGIKLVSSEPFSCFMVGDQLRMGPLQFKGEKAVVIKTNLMVGKEQLKMNMALMFDEEIFNSFKGEKSNGPKKT